MNIEFLQSLNIKKEVGILIENNFHFNFYAKIGSIRYSPASKCLTGIIPGAKP